MQHWQSKQNNPEARKQYLLAHSDWSLKITSTDQEWEAKIKMIINNRCANCHSGTWTSRKLLLENKTEVLRRIDAAAPAAIKMPKNGNFSGTESADLTNWLNATMP